jgi:hypothetical protein
VGDPAYLKSKASSVKGISKQGSASTMGMDLGFERLVGDPAYLKSKASSVKGISRQGQSKVYKVLLQRRPVKV